MKQWKRVLSVCAFTALLLTICVPALSAASADGEGTIPITISGTLNCYAENGKQVGLLNYLNDGEATYQAKGSKEAIGVTVLYAYTAESTGVKADALEGKVKVSLQFIPPDMNAPAAQDDPSASPAPEVTAAPLPEFPSEVWVDASVIIPALNAGLVQRDNDISEKADQIAALQTNGEVQILEASPAPTSDAAGENENTEEVQPDLLESLLLPIIACAVLLVIAGGVIWLAVSSARIAREAKENNCKTSTKNTHLDSMQGSLKTLSMRKDTGSVLEEALIDPVSKRPYVKAVATETEETRSILARIESKLDRNSPSLQASQAGQEMDPVRVSWRDVLALTKNLAGIASREDWAKIIQEKGYRYILVQTSPTDREALQEDLTGNSVLACVMKGAEAAEAYLVPSFEDPSAGENRWKDFYTVTDDPAEKHYRIDEPTVMKVIKGTFFVVDSKGKLTRRL